MIYLVSNILLFVGVIFFIIGTIGVFRFVDLYTRLHALAKIDNLGLGFIVIGLVMRSDDIFVILKLILIWALILLSSATLTYIFASHSNKSGELPYLGDQLDS